MDLESQKARSNKFHQRSAHGLFAFSTGAVDGLAFQTRTPNKRDFLKQAQFHSGSKK